MNSIYTWAVTVLLALSTCTVFAQNTKSVPQDTAKVYKMMHFEEKVHTFSNIPAGQKIEHTFTFENKGKRAFKILDVQTACFCTAVEWSKKTFKPGDKGEIKVIFDTKKARGHGVLTKNVIVISTATNKEVILKVKGTLLR